MKITTGLKMPFIWSGTVETLFPGVKESAIMLKLFAKCLNPAL
jgi:hypothetical protein